MSRSPNGTTRGTSQPLPLVQSIVIMWSVNFVPNLTFGPVDRHHVVGELCSKFDLLVPTHELFPLGRLRLRHLQVLGLYWLVNRVLNQPSYKSGSEIEPNSKRQSATVSWWRLFFPYFEAWTGVSSGKAGEFLKVSLAFRVVGLDVVAHRRWRRKTGLL